MFPQTKLCRCTLRALLASTAMDVDHQLRPNSPAARVHSRARRVKGGPSSSQQHGAASLPTHLARLRLLAGDGEARRRLCHVKAKFQVGAIVPDAHSSAAGLAANPTLHSAIVLPSRTWRIRDASAIHRRLDHCHGTALFPLTAGICQNPVHSTSRYLLYVAETFLRFGTDDDSLDAIPDDLGRSHKERTWLRRVLAHQPRGMTCLQACCPCIFIP